MKNYLYAIACGALSVFAAAGIVHGASPAAVNLGTAERFAVLAGSGVSNTPMSSIVGDVGVSPAGRASITGFNISGTQEVTGYLYAADDIAPSSAPAMLQKAKDDLGAAYNDAASRTPTAEISGNLGGQTLLPGVYHAAGPVEISSGDLTLNAQGDANAVWIFEIASALTTTSGRVVKLAGGAQAQNIFWQVGASVTIGSGTIFNGNIIANQSIALGAVTKLGGRALARNGSVTLAYNNIQIPEESPAVPTLIAIPAPGSYPVTQPAPAPTTSSNDEMAKLQSALAELQKQVAAQSAGATVAPAAPKASATSAGNVNEVRALQVFLNTHGFQIAASGAGSPGQETTKIGALTKKALCAFQVKEGVVKSAKDASCGVYGPKTKSKVKAMSI